MIYRSLTYFLVIGIFCIASTPVFSEEAIVIGVAESFAHRWKSSPVSGADQDVFRHYLSAKPLFEYKDREWYPLTTSESVKHLNPSATNWAMVLEGKPLGELKLEDSLSNQNIKYDWIFPREYHYNIVNLKDVPFIAHKPSVSRWSTISKNRPLILTTKSNPNPHDGWASFIPSDSYITIIWPMIQQEFVNKEYQDKDLTIRQAYHDEHDSVLIQVGRESEKLHWFYITSKIAKYIGAQLSLLDTGDYDHDGQDELIFTYQGYNKDGYVLFDPEFNTPVEYLWTYH